MINKIKLKCQTCGKAFEVWSCRSEAKFCSNGCRYKSRVGKKGTRPITRIKKRCLNCNKIFEDIKSRENKAKFCSRKCYLKYIRNHSRLIEKVCFYCGRKFKTDRYHVNKGEGKYCSHFCGNKDRKSKKIERICLNCGKRFYSYKYFLDKNGGKFCSVDCYKDFRINQGIMKKCPICGKEFRVSASHEVRIYCSRQCSGIAQIGKPTISGEDHYNWKGGISFEPYSIDWTETLKRSIRERDKYICQICGQYGNIVHHKDYNKLNCNPDNLVILCRKCHTKTNHNREYWKQYFQVLTYEYNQSQLQFV